MAYRLRWTTTAADDLEEIATFIAQDSPPAADRVVRRLRTAVRSLAEHPERARRVPELEDGQLRELLIGSYRLIFRIQGEAVFIMALVHGARDLAALWERRGGSP